MPAHRTQIKVYYEDTDCLGMVYHANYLRYFERARTEYVATGGREIHEWNALGFLIIVYSASLRFRAAGRLGDVLEIVTTHQARTPYRMAFLQEARRGAELLVHSEVELACLDADRRLIPFPPILAQGGDAG
jgi:tol-pal system-associated acyl-CoA thioesterase